MGFSNGYDSGYADALEDVRSGRVAGLGPNTSEGTNGGNGGASLPSVTPVARTPKVFTLASSAANGGISPELSRYGSVETLECTGEVSTGTDDMGDSIVSASVSISGPTGGFVAGDVVMFNCDLSEYEDDISITIDGINVKSVVELEGTNVLWYDGSSLVLVYHTSF